MASEECERATDVFKNKFGAARACEEMVECNLSFEDLKEVGDSYYQADYICGGELPTLE